MPSCRPRAPAAEVRTRARGPGTVRSSFGGTDASGESALDQVDLRMRGGGRRARLRGRHGSEGGRRNAARAERQGRARERGLRLRVPAGALRSHPPRPGQCDRRAQSARRAQHAPRRRSRRPACAPDADTIFDGRATSISATDRSCSRCPDSGKRFTRIELVDSYTNVFASLGQRLEGNETASFAIAGPGLERRRRRPEDGALADQLRVAPRADRDAGRARRARRVGPAAAVDADAGRRLRDGPSASPAIERPSGGAAVESPGRAGRVAAPRRSTPRKSTHLLKLDPPASADAPLVKKFASIGIDWQKDKYVPGKIDAATADSAWKDARAASAARSPPAARWTAGPSRRRRGASASTTSRARRRRGSASAAPRSPKTPSRRPRASTRRGSAVGRAPLRARLREGAADERVLVAHAGRRPGPHGRQHAQPVLGARRPARQGRREGAGAVRAARRASRPTGCRRRRAPSAACCASTGRSPRRSPAAGSRPR